MSDPRTAALAVALHNRQHHTRPSPCASCEVDAAAILAALPADWCGHHVTPDGTVVSTMPLDGDHIHRLLNDLGHFDNQCPAHDMDPRTAALAEALHLAMTDTPGLGDRPELWTEAAVKFLAALPADWCGHDAAWTSAVTHALSDRNEELVREVARLREIEEAARALIVAEDRYMDPDDLDNTTDAFEDAAAVLRAALEADR
jgi:hypothetical protein